MSDKKRRLQVSNERTNTGGAHEVTITGDKEDVVALAGALQFGMKWIRMLSNGTIETSDVYTHPPAPTNDPHMQNIWQFNPLPEGTGVQMQLFRNDLEMEDPKNKWSKDNRSIYLQSIQGYAGKDAYERRAKILSEAGFACLRSQRGKDGKYWEIWYLSGPCCGHGPIKDKKTADEVKDWVMRNIGPGTLTMGGEHWGLSLE